VNGFRACPGDARAPFGRGDEGAAKVAGDINIEL
jgi:hypothetical protein